MTHARLAFVIEILDEHQSDLNQPQIAMLKAGHDRIIDIHIQAGKGEAIDQPIETVGVNYLGDAPAEDAQTRRCGLDTCKVGPRRRMR